MTEHQIGFTQEQFEKELEKYFVEQLKLNPLRIFHDFPETWKYFWFNFKLNKNQVNEFMNKMHDEWLRTGIRFYGAPTHAYRKNNFIVCTKDAKHYVIWGFSSFRKDLLKYSTVVCG